MRNDAGFGIVTHSTFTDAQKRRNAPLSQAAGEQRVNGQRARVPVPLKGTETRHAELRDHGRTGCELQLFVNADFVHGQRYNDRAAAVMEAVRVRIALEAVGFK